MNDDRSQPFWQSQTLRLTSIYLAIIMTMSLGFSAIIYGTSATQLERQLPTKVYVDDLGEFGPSERVQEYIQLQIREGKRELVIRLVLLNTIMLLAGFVISYALARRTLQPIERSIAAQSQFVSDASHELRTPLTAMYTANQVALRKKRLPVAEARRVIAGNVEDIERLQRMTTMLLNLAADDMKLDITTVPLADIVSQSMTNVAGEAIQRSIAVDDQTTKLTALVDKDAAVQILTVLLDNAIKYSDNQATITLTSPRTWHRFIQLSVEDKGVGIAKADQAKVFTRFYRSDNARTRQANGGHGLGLAIAEKLAKAHGGSLELTSSRTGKNSGSTFSVYLPLAPKSKR